MTGDDALPYRVVDGHGHGWFRTGAGTYEADYAGPIAAGPARVRPGAEHGVGWTYADLARRRGPLRHVIPLPDARRDELAGYIGRAEEQAAATVLLAVYTVRSYLLGTHGNADVLLAGRAGSWESVSTAELADHYGQGIYLANTYHPEVLFTVTGVLAVWVGGTKYIEVAENLAAAFGQATDTAGGWDQMAQDPLRQDERLRNLLTSTSASYWKDKQP